MSRVLRFDGQRLVLSPDPLSEGASPDVADSFLLKNGNVRALEAHRQRFHASVGLHAPELFDSLASFNAACAAELSELSEAFPRLEVVDGSLWLRVRPVPELSETATAVSERVDVPLPELKGPNISLYSALNNAHNCETLRVDAQGDILEGTSSAVVWWSDNTLYTVAATQRVTSTTEQFLSTVARDLGYTVVQSTLPLANLVEHEAWLINALHGIRPLLSLDGIQLPSVNQARLVAFKTALDQSWLPLA